MVASNRVPRSDACAGAAAPSPESVLNGAADPARAKAAPGLLRALRTMVGRLPSVRDDVLCYVVAHTDLARLAARRAARRFVVALFLFAALGAWFVLASWRVLAGAAGGLAAALGNTWLADLILGTSVLGLLAACVAVIGKVGARRRWRRLERRYQRRETAVPVAAVPVAAVVEPVGGSRAG